MLSFLDRNIAQGKALFAPIMAAALLAVAAPSSMQAQTSWPSDMLNQIMGGILVTELCESQCYSDLRAGSEYCRKAAENGTVVYWECMAEVSAKYLQCRDSCPPLPAPETLDLPF
jgi:hypothetical protein